MVRSLLSFPPELLVNILSFLPVQALLRFSQTCRYSHSIAHSSLHTLSLGIHPTRVSGIISRLGATRYPQLKTIESSFSRPAHPPSAHVKANRAQADEGESDSLSDEPLSDDDPYRVSVLIPDAQTFDHMTLLSFHTALTKSILTRHGVTLRNLELSLWTLTTPIAKALSDLSALRALSVRIEDLPHVRAVPRSRIAAQRHEQREAWTLLANTAVWAPRLTALRIEGGEITSTQMVTLLRRSRWCRELWACKCSLIGKKLWSFLGSKEWEGRAALRILGIMRCGGQLDEEVLDVIGGLSALQVSHVLPKNSDKWGC